VFSVILACGYFFLMVVFSQVSEILQGALIRVLIFILVAGVITYLSEIQKKTQEALRESETKFHEIFDNVNDAIHLHKVDRQGLPGTFIDVNMVACRMLGYSKDELLRKGPLDIATDFHSIPLEQIGREFRTQGHSIFETEHRRKDGSIIPVEVSGHIVVLQGKELVLAVVRDISERKHAETALRESEEFNRGLVENMPDIVAVYGTDRKIRFINPVVSHLLGYMPDSILGTDILSLVAEDDREKLGNAIARRIASQNPQPIEIDLMKKDGDRVTVITKGTTTYFRNERVFLLMLTDISDRKRYEREMQLRSEQIERTSLALGLANKKLNLLGSLTRHDILNKLSILLAYNKNLQKGMKNTEVLQTLETEESIIRTIGEYLAFTKMYEKIGVSAPVWIRLDEVIQRAAAAISHGDVIIETDLDGFEVYADPLLEKVFANLLDNAIRHGGHITKINISAQESGAGLAIVCEDDGVGIPDEDKEYVFERGVGKNTGMGLFLAREILSMTWMNIREKGIPGKGARFEIDVPPGVYRFEKTGGKGRSAL
jgi:PAS domain S-box-containing protein